MMSLPTMSIINFTSTLDDREVQHAVRAVNRQVIEDFAPIWGTAYSLRLHNSPIGAADPDTLSEDPVRGESVMYLVDEQTIPGALGYHASNSRNIPVGFVFITDTNDWTTTLSHEVLELIVDPTVNVLVPGPDPRNSGNTVLHAYEVCDAVERTSYFIDGIEVSNFVTQSWFTPGDELGTRNDFLGIDVPSFEAIRDSHLAFFDLSTNDWVTYINRSAAIGGALSQRAETYHRTVRDRDNDRIQKTFDTCCQTSEFAESLPYLHGLTRGARYKARAVEMFGPPS